MTPRNHQYILEDALAQSRVMAPVEITEDYYAILEVSQAASSDTIRKSYRRLAVLLHPDKNPNKPNATAAFQLLLRAYETTSDPGQRILYDVRWEHIRTQANAQQEAKKRAAEAAETERKDNLNKQREQKARQERLERLYQQKSSLDRDAFELSRVVTRLTNEIKRLQEQGEEEKRKERANDSWWTFVTSPIYGKTKESDEMKQRREEERRQRLTSRYIKSFELEQKETRFKELMGSLLDLEKQIAAENKKSEDEARAQEYQRQEQLRQEQAARWKQEQEVRKRQEEQRARDLRAAWERTEAERRGKNAQRAEEAARKTQEAMEERARKQREQRAREEVERRERAEASRKAEAAARAADAARQKIRSNSGTTTTRSKPTSTQATVFRQSLSSLSNMGTRGYKAWRFRKRYYVHYYRYDDYPEGLGNDIAMPIPNNPQEYASWLEKQRNMVEVWEAIWNKLLAQASPDGEETTLAPFMVRHNPSCFVPLQDIHISRVYIIDLDREIFSVNNGAHFKLEQMPHIDWMRALDVGRFDEQILLPPLLPEGAIATVMAQVPPVGQAMYLVEGVATGGALTSGLDNRKIEKGKARELLRRKVTPKNVDAIPWRQRHGPVLGSMLIRLWSMGIDTDLTTTLLQWAPDDFPFRHVKPEFENAYVTGFFSVLATGAHHKGGPAGCAPEETIYWLGDVLVFLTTQLYRADAVGEEISRVVKHCQVHYSGKIVDAVLTSIEQVILVYVIPGSEVQHTGLLPFIKIEIHMTTDIQDRYTDSKQKKCRLDAMNAQNIYCSVEYSESEEEESDLAFDPHHNCAEEGFSEFSTFYALMHLFDAAAVRHLPYTKTRDGRLPNERYPKVLHYVTDIPTRLACMTVSRLFRRICPEDLLFTDGIILPPSKTLRNITGPMIFPKWFEMQDLEKEKSVRMSFARASRSMAKGNEVWRVAVGTARNGKTRGAIGIVVLTTLVATSGLLETLIMA
ncbi:MAG: hypothetical protein Q9194_006235 [Teloschistes cf. exilis]